MLISAGTEKDCNTMTASWGMFGGLWRKNVVQIFIRPQRFTKTFIDSYDSVTLSFLPERYREINLLLCSDKRCQPLNEILSFTLTPDMNLEEASNQPWWKIWLAAQQGKKEGAYSTTARIPDP